ncbi:MAG: pyridoxal phosphate-dependent aminotransferase, partial [Patescibacteria group bacterium]
APAGGFYAAKGLGKNEVRIAYVINRKDLKRCTELLKKALDVYNRKK